MAKRGRPTKEEAAIAALGDRGIYRCFYCNKEKSQTAFYQHKVFYNKSGLSPICKQCASDIANRVEYGVTQGATIDSMLLALRLMDMPFIQDIFNEADRVAKSPTSEGTQNKTIFGHYISILAVTKYSNSTWDDTERTLSDVSAQRKEIKKTKAAEVVGEVAEEAEQNKKDCLRLMGYDVFANEPDEDKPYLYSQLIKYLDASPEANEDAMKVASIVQIVKSYYQASKINDVIAEIIANPETILDNASTLKSLQSTQKTLMDTALSLAKDNGISFAHNNNNSKGANTLSGKLKKMKELNLREIEVNTFDIGTSEGMRKVADISNASILGQIRLNENDIPEMIADQRILIEKWEEVAYKASEQARLLLRENSDLKDYIRSIGKGDILEDRSFVIDAEGGVNDTDLLDDEFRKSMEESQIDIWADAESAAGESDEESAMVSDEDDEEIIVDPEDITSEDDEEVPNEDA